MTVSANTNLSDAVDANEIPAEQEQRQDEIINSPDVIDENKEPAILEDRKKKEKWRSDYSEEQEDMKQQNNKGQ